MFEVIRFDRPSQVQPRKRLMRHMASLMRVVCVLACVLVCVSLRPVLAADQGGLRLRMSGTLTAVAPDSADLQRSRDGMRQLRSQLQADTARRFGPQADDGAPMARATTEAAADVAAVAAISALPLPLPLPADTTGAPDAAASASASGVPSAAAHLPGISPPPVSANAEKEVAWPRTKSHPRRAATDGYQSAMESLALVVLAAVAALWLVRRLRKTSSGGELPF